MSDTTAGPPETRVKVQSTLWWVLLLQGITSIIIGVLLLADTAATLITIVIFLGVYWLISGIFDIVMLFVDSTHWGWKLFHGVIGILAGLFIVRDPLWAAIAVPATLVWIIGFLGLIIGISSLIHSFSGGGAGAAIRGAVTAIFGLILLGNTLMSVSVLIVVVAIWGIVGGIVAVIGAFYLRPKAAN